MSIIKVIIPTTRYKILFDSVCKQESLLHSSHFLSFPQFNFFFLVKRKFAKKGVIGMLNSMKLKCDLLHRKNCFSWCKKSHFIFSLTLVIGALYDMKVECNLMCQIHKCHLKNQKFFPLCKKSQWHFIFFNKTGYVSCIYDIASR